ncbi:MAG: sugar ABC transporter substrate-binding protein [Candidatus Dormibacteraeota bacterium]|nr:sugar ABC transporter substrate-binding protein [Candidatus Dormibacteraeota bacterium]
MNFQSLSMRTATLALGAGLVLTACGGTSSSGSTKHITLALVLDDLTNPVELPLRKGAQDMAAKDGFTLKVVGPSPATAQQQISLMQDLQQQKVDGTIILPVDSAALVPAINSMVAAHIPVATTEIDAPTSNRSFFYIGGSSTIDQGKLSAQRVFKYFKDKGVTGTINYVLTSCLPTVTGQQERRSGFEAEVQVENATSPFKLTQVGFYDTSTDPAKNFANTQNIYTAKGSQIQLAYAMCGPDTQNWGKVLKANSNHNVLVAGYDWLPATLDLIGEGWVGWAQGNSLYNEGTYAFTQMYDHVANGKALPTGVIHGTSIFCDKNNLAEIRNSPDVKAAGG